MATAESTARTVTEKTITLTLSEAEASVLVRILWDHDDGSAEVMAVHRALRYVYHTAETPTPYIYKGVTYVRGAQYMDNEGDTWTVGDVNADGAVAVSCYDIREFSVHETLAEAVDRYGPLTRV